MKKLIFIFLIGIASSAQGVYFSTGFDKSLSNSSTFGMLGHNKVEVTINNEYSKRLDYNRFSFGIGYHIERVIPFTQKEILIIPSVNFGLIDRWSDWDGGLSDKDNKSSHLGFGASLSFQIDLNETFALRLKTEIVDRVDNRTKYGTAKIMPSSFVELLIKL